MLTKNLLKLALAALAGHAVAEPASSSGLSENDFFADLPVVLSVSRLAQPLRDAPGAVTAIDAEMIRASGARDLADLLRLVPGFQVAYQANKKVNGAPLAVYHGMTSDTPAGLQILIDGRSQYSPMFFGGVSWNTVDVALADIERIEVIRGSNSAAFGSNAFLGVINIVTYHASQVPSATLAVGQGSQGVADRFARVGTTFGAASVRLSVERKADNGLRNFNDSRITRRWNLRGDMPLTSVDQLQVHAGVATVGVGMGEAGSLDDPARERGLQARHVQAQWRHALGQGEDVALRVYRAWEESDDAYSTDPFPISSTIVVPPVFIDYRVHARRDDVEFQHVVAPSFSSRLVWGVGWRADAVQSAQFYATDSWQTQSIDRLFGNLEWRPAGNWVTNVGATWEHNSLSGTALAPRAMLNYHADAAQTLRIGVSRAQRIPTLFEARVNERYATPLLPLPLDIRRVSSGPLEPEKITSQEVGYLGDFKPWRLFADVRVFRERVEDRIAPINKALFAPDCEVFEEPPFNPPAGHCGGASDYDNMQDLRIRGVEYQLKWSPHETTALIFNQAHLRIVSNAWEDKGAQEIHMNESAPRRASTIVWRQRLPRGLDFFLAYYHATPFRWTPRTKVLEYHRLDWRVAYAFHVGGAKGELAYAVQGDGSRHGEWVSDQVGAREARNQWLYPRGFLTLRLEY